MIAYAVEEFVQVLDVRSAYVVEDPFTLSLTQESQSAPPGPTPIPPGSSVQTTIVRNGLPFWSVPGQQEAEEPFESEIDAPDLAAHMLMETMSTFKYAPLIIRLAWRMRKPRQ